MGESNLMLHCGGEAAKREELDLVPMPQETATYKPISHYALTQRIETISQDLLQGFTLARQSFGLAREGNQLFALMTFKNHNTEIGLSIGYRNSYDKSMSIGLACGASVFVCDNMALRGDIEISRKHTGEVWDELEAKLIAVCYRSSKTFGQIEDNSAKLKEITFDDKRAFQTMGELYGNGIISPRQLATVKAEWLKPSFEAFAPRNAWSFYNANTQALKTSPPTAVMENHLHLSRFFDANVIEATYEPITALVPAVVVPSVLPI